MRRGRMIHFQKKNNEFVPVSKSDIDIWNKVKENVTYCMRFKSDRNYLHHKKLFAIAKTIIDNQPDGSLWENKQPYALIKSSELMLGYTNQIMDMNGKITIEPIGINFEEMSQELFEKLYEDVINYWCSHFGSDRDTLENYSMEII
jgi:hypothetical protein